MASPDAAVAEVTDAAVQSRVGAAVPPAAPSFVPCPEGWSELAAAGGIVCEPPALEVEIDETCPPDGTPVIDSGAPVLYVRAGATGGDGSLARPYGTVSAAVARATSGTTIAVASGRYPERVSLPTGITLVGACPSETVIAPTLLDGQVAMALIEPSSALRDVRIAPVGGGGLLVDADVRVSRVLVEGSVDFGVVVRGGTLDVSELAVVGTTATARPGSGVAIIVASGGRLTGSGVAVRGSDTAALLADGAATSVVLRRFQAWDNGGGDVSQPRTLSLQGGARVELDEAVIVSGRGQLAVVREGSAITLTNALLRNAGSDAELGVASGVQVDGASLTLQRARIEGATNAIDLRGGDASLEDVAITGTGSAGAGVGFFAGFGSTAELDRVLVDESGWIGVMVVDGSLRAADVHVRATARGAEGFGLGIGDAQVEAARLRVERSAGSGVVIEGASTVVVTDLAIIDTESRASDGRDGRGLEVQRGAVVRVERALVERSREVGILAFHEADLQLTDVRVADTRSRACASTSCADAPGGTGIGAYSGSRVRATGFVIETAPLCGVQVATAATLDLSDGEIRDVNVGACVQVAGYDLARVTSGVVFTNNSVNVDTAEHAVPEPAPLPEL